MARILIDDWLTEDGLRKLELYKRRGLSDKQIAEKIGISEATFTRWKKKEMSIVNALKKGKQSGIDQVEITMFDKAIGFFDENGIYHAPDTTAGIFILKNMRPEHYRDKPYNALETQKLNEEIRQLKLTNEMKQRALDGESEYDKLQEIIDGIDHVAFGKTEEVLDE